MTLFTALAALLAFEVKHFLGDFVLQTKWQVDSKKRYLAPGGLLHAAIHAILTVPVLMVFTAAPAVLIGVPVAEFLLHYHIDFAKARIDVATGWTGGDQAYWFLFGFDQLLHQLTYLGIVAYFALYT
jgi:hypothetical protein